MSTEPREPRPGRSRRPIGGLVTIIVIVVLAAGAYFLAPRILVRMALQGRGPIPAATIHEMTAAAGSFLQQAGISRDEAVALIRRLKPETLTALAQAVRTTDRSSPTRVAETAIRELELDRDTAGRLLSMARGQILDPTGVSSALEQFDRFKGVLPLAMPALRSALEEAIKALPPSP
jgi:hypothetical protein